MCIKNFQKHVFSSKYACKYKTVHSLLMLKALLCIRIIYIEKLDILIKFLFNYIKAIEDFENSKDCRVFQSQQLLNI